MKAIKITQDIKDKNKLFENMPVGYIYTRGVPNKFNGQENVVGGYQGRTDLHEDDGWYELVEPETTDSGKLGELYFDNTNNIFTYPIENKTQTEIENTKINNQQLQKNALLEDLKNKKLIKDMQTVEDDNELLAIAPIFPIWEPGMVLELGNKVQHFKDGELVLFRVEQAHTTQADWEPATNPALFTRVGYEGEILEWQQPTGAQDAYNTGDRVLFEGKTYESTIDNNTWSPTAYPQGWTEIV